MTIAEWLDHAKEDAGRRSLTALQPLLDALARATETLRAAAWNDDATGVPQERPARHVR